MVINPNPIADHEPPPPNTKGSPRKSRRAKKPTKLTSPQKIDELVDWFTKAKISGEKKKTAKPAMPIALASDAASATADLVAAAASAPAVPAAAASDKAKEAAASDKAKDVLFRSRVVLSLSAGANLRSLMVYMLY